MDNNDAMAMGIAITRAVETTSLVFFDALYHKGLLNYSDVQDAIGRIRADIPAKSYDPMVKAVLDRLEQVIQPGGIQFPKPSPGDPQP